MAQKREREKGLAAAEQASAVVEEIGSSGRSVAKRAGRWITHDVARAVSPKRLLKWAALRTALALARRHLGIVAAGVGTLVAVGSGGYLLGRRSRRV
jgi:hypothetical protein